MVSDEEKSRVMSRCVESMPRQWRIAGKCYQRLAVLGKGSWAVAFSAKLVDESVARQMNDTSTQGDDRSELNSTEPPTTSSAAVASDPRVYLVPETTEKMGEFIAVKAIVKEVHSAQSLIKYPRREVDLMRRLTLHENVMKLFAYWQDDKGFYLAMELCVNRSLSSIIKSKDTSRVIDNSKMKRYLLEMLQGLHYIHQQMIIHRDIKPDNVLLNADYQIKISDFGLSTTVASVSDLIHSLCGTPKYQAPEIIRKIGYSFPVDIWSVGCIFYRLHYQIAPFDGPSTAEIYERLLADHVIYQRLNRYCSPVCDDDLRLMRWMLKKNPKTRATIEQLLADRYLQADPSPVNATANMSKLDYMMYCLERLAQYDLARRPRRLNYSQRHDSRLTPAFWVHQSIVETTQAGLVFYTYNNAHLYGCTFPDRSRMLHANGRTLIYCAKGASNYYCFEDTDTRNLSQDLQQKRRTLLGKREQLFVKACPRVYDGQFDVPVEIDRANLDRLPWLERRIQFRGYRRFVMANAYHLRMGRDWHLFQIGYLYGSGGRSNRNNPKWLLLDSSKNSITVLKHNTEMFSVKLDFVLAENCTAMMQKYVKYSLKYIKMLVDASK